MVEIKRTNPKIFQQIDLRLRELQNVVGRVGWFESSKYEDGTPVAYVAAIQEFGSPGKNIPARPTMRPAAIESEFAVEQIAVKGANRILAGKATPEQVMEAITLYVEGQVSKNISTLTTPVLSPATIKARRSRGANSKKPRTMSVKPLNDTGLMIATLTHTVENANS